VDSKGFVVAGALDPFGHKKNKHQAWRPVVAAAGGALLEFVSDGETGLLVPPRDAPALRAAVERLLGDRELRERLGAAARNRARERFGWDAVSERTLAVCRDALASG
jgi:glycosyltransferase involved in cell wall biosynthesis